MSAGVFDSMTTMIPYNVLKTYFSSKYFSIMFFILLSGAILSNIICNNNGKCCTLYPLLHRAYSSLKKKYAEKSMSDEHTIYIEQKKQEK